MEENLSYLLKPKSLPFATVEPFPEQQKKPW